MINYTYSPEGLRVSRDTVPGRAERYAYDDAHRLIQVRYGNERRVDYQLDPLGNPQLVQELTDAGGLIKSVSSTFNAFNQITASQAVTPSGLGPSHS